MKSIYRFKFVTLVALVLSVSIPVIAQESISLEELRRREREGKLEKKMPKKKKEKIPYVLAEGSNSKVDVPFVFVARDNETLGQLSKLIDGFKLEQEIDFQKMAVVGAFSGTKSTGGHSVLIRFLNGKVKIEDLSPIHGSIVTTAITTPYRVSLIPLNEEQSVDLEMSDLNPKKENAMSWKQNMKSMNVTNGEFQYSGGFVGVEKKFEVTGSVYEMTFGDLKTFVFDLKGKTEDKKMTGAATAVNSSGKWSISRMEPGGLIDSPHPPFVVGINPTRAGYEFSFEPGKRPYVVNDGFSGSGKIVTRFD